MNIPQISPFITIEEYEEIKDCFKNNWFTEGPKADEFISKAKEMLGVKYALFAPNATLGLYLALRAAGVEPGDEVIVADFTFYASATSIEMVGAIPVFCEVNRNNFQIDVNGAHKLVTPKTKAIMPVHMYGMCVNVNEIEEFASRYHLKVVEDAAEAFGVKFGGYKYAKNGDNTIMAGTTGDIGVYSFYADKTITTGGEGGLIVTDNEKMHNKILYYRNQGRLSAGTFVHPEIGYNFRLTDLQAGIGLVQLRKLDQIIQNKLRIWDSFSEKLSNVEEVSMLKVENGSSHIPFRTTLLAESAHELMRYLGTQGIQPRTFFYPMHKQPGLLNKFKNYGKPISFDDTDFENSCYGYNYGVCLPCFPSLSEEQIQYITEKIKMFYSRK